MFFLDDTSMGHQTTKSFRCCSFILVKSLICKNNLQLFGEKMFLIRDVLVHSSVK